GAAPLLGRARQRAGPPARRAPGLRPYRPARRLPRRAGRHRGGGGAADPHGGPGVRHRRPAGGASTRRRPHGAAAAQRRRPRSLSAPAAHEARGVRDAAAPVRVGYVGALGPWFDVDAVQEAARVLSGWHFRLAGKVEDPEVAALSALPNLETVG